MAMEGRRVDESVILSGIGPRVEEVKAREAPRCGEWRWEGGLGEMEVTSAARGGLLGERRAREKMSEHTLARRCGKGRASALRKWPLRDEP